MSWQTIRIETERLILRPPQIDDFDDYAVRMADIEACRFIGGVQPRSVAWRTDGTWAVSWQPGSTDLDSLLRRLGLLSAVAASIRPHVFQQYGIDTAGWDPTAPPTATL